jgi:hypothetical protein
MPSRSTPIGPVPDSPRHRRDWRTLWRRCICGLPAPCIDARLTLRPPATPDESHGDDPDRTVELPPPRPGPEPGVYLSRHAAPHDDTGPTGTGSTSSGPTETGLTGIEPTGRSGPPRPRAPLDDRPGSPRRDQPGAPRHDRPGSPRRDQPGAPRHDRPGSQRHDQPGSPRHDRPVAPRHDHNVGRPGHLTPAQIQRANQGAPSRYRRDIPGPHGGPP